MMNANILERMALESRHLGCKPGENAKQWRERDPKAAAQFGEWLKHNMTAVTKGIAKAVQS